MRPRILLACGTRPEAVKLAPVVVRLREDADLDVRLLVTGQHREICDEVLAAFGLVPDDGLDVLAHGQSLASLASRAMSGLERALERISPDALVVQGDTTTAFAAALAAFSARIPVTHVEAGLRTGDLGQPFPEEANRKLISVLASLHLAPTPWSKENLLAEGIPAQRIAVTGNTVVDALGTFLHRPFELRTAGLERALAAPGLVVVTTHRRENWGEPQRRVARAVSRLARLFPEVAFLVPLHPNPEVRRTLCRPLAGVENAILTEPLRYAEMVHTLARAALVITDSGGIQEECCALGVPALVLRDVTERPEGVAAGVVRLVGSREAAVLDTSSAILRDPRSRAEMAHASAAFGDGRAADRCCAAIRRSLGLPADRVEEFAPAAIDVSLVEEEVDGWLVGSSAH